jgi:hypothetical protein
MKYQSSLKERCLLKIKNCLENDGPSIRSKIGTPRRTFTEITQLNLSLKGNTMNIFTAQDNVASFLSKSQLYRRRVEASDVSKKLKLTIRLEKTKKKCYFADNIRTESIGGYFPDTGKRVMNAWILTPHTVKEKVSEDKAVKENAEVLDPREVNTLKAVFQDSDMAMSWCKAG